jgi:hypothetical protein
MQYINLQLSNNDIGAARLTFTELAIIYKSLHFSLVSCIDTDTSSCYIHIPHTPSVFQNTHTKG